MCAKDKLFLKGHAQAAQVTPVPLFYCRAANEYEIKNLEQMFTKRIILMSLKR